MTKKKSKIIKCEFDKKGICVAAVCNSLSRECKARDSFGDPKYALVTHRWRTPKREQIRAKDGLDSIKG